MSKAFWVKIPPVFLLWILRSMAKPLYGKTAILRILLDLLLYEGFNDLGEAVDTALERGTGEILLTRNVTVPFPAKTTEWGSWMSIPRNKSICLRSHKGKWRIRVYGSATGGYEKKVAIFLLRSNSHLEINDITFEIGGRFNSADNILVLALGDVNLQQGPRLLPFEFLYNNGWRTGSASEVVERLKKVDTPLSFESVDLMAGFKSEVFTNATAL